VRVVAVAVVVVLLVLTTSVRPVAGRSMWRTLEGEGDRDWVLIDRISHLFGQPGRFRLCVFRSKDELSVKRLVGLPGETIDFRGGDVFVGTGGGELERVARPPELVESQLVPVPPAASAAPLLEADGPSAKDGDATTWTPKPGQTLTVVLRYGAGADSRCITDDHLVRDDRSPTGERVAPGRHAVPDVRVTVDSISAGGGSITFVHEIGLGDLRRVAVTAAGVEISARVGGIDSVRAAFPKVLADSGLRFETIDGQFRVALREGGGWIELFRELRDTEHHEGDSCVRFEVKGGPVRVGRLEVARDVHYVWGAENPASPLSIPADRMFLVGDNPEFSTDSRGLGPVPVRSLAGVVRAVVFPWGRRRIPR
jgi:signal peptidase I